MRLFRNLIILLLIGAAMFAGAVLTAQVQGSLAVSIKDAPNRLENWSVDLRPTEAIVRYRLNTDAFLYIMSEHGKALHIILDASCTDPLIIHAAKGAAPFAKWFIYRPESGIMDVGYVDGVDQDDDEPLDKP